MKFSIVYPTCHRPELISTALRFLEAQNYENFEVIVCDNWTDGALSCEDVCRRSSLKELRYIRPPKPLGLVDNWEYATSHATGDYVCLLTDKMYLLPTTLERAVKCIEETGAEIVNWYDAPFIPSDESNLFGSGHWVRLRSDSSTETGSWSVYNPQDALSRRGRAEVSRGEQTRELYTIGKICFGAYNTDLCQQIRSRTGRLFHNLTPDYSSMILALSYASSGAHFGSAGAVSLSCDLSIGNEMNVSDLAAWRYLSALDGGTAAIDQLPVPHVYASLHNLVAHDFVKLKERYELPFELNLVNWVTYIMEDLQVQERFWSSSEIRRMMNRRLAEFIQELPRRDQIQLLRRLRKRRSKRRWIWLVETVRGKIGNKLPHFLVPMWNRSLWLSGAESKYDTTTHDSIFDILLELENNCHEL